MVELNNLNNKISRKFNGWNLKKGKFCFEPNSWRFLGSMFNFGSCLLILLFFGETKALWTQYKPSKTKGKTTWKYCKLEKETHRSKQSFWSILVVSLEFFGGVLFLGMVENRTSNQSPSFKINPIHEIVPRNVAHNSPPRAASNRR